MNNLLHVSGNILKPLNNKTSTKEIWVELSKEFDNYHIIGRSSDNKFHYYNEGKLHLHLVPKLFHVSFFLITSFYIKKIIKKYNINYILSQCPIIGGVTSNYYGKKYNIPVFQEIHDTYYFDLNKNNTLKNKVLYKLLKYSIINSTNIRALNSMMKDKINKLNLNVNDKIVIVENRVNVNLFNKIKENFELQTPIKLCSVGTFVERKGYHILIEAVKELKKKYDINLILIGGGKEKEYYKKSLDDKTLILYDRISQNEIVNILTNCDIYLQPSLREGMPRTILEAMALKLPIITTNISVIPGTVINNENGIVIESNNKNELINSIERLIKDKELRKKIANNGYNDAITKYEWDKQFDLYRKSIINMKREIK